MSAAILANSAYASDSEIAARVWRNRHEWRRIGPKAFSHATAMCKHPRATEFVQQMLEDLKQRLPKITAVKIADALAALGILRRLFPELDELTFLSQADSNCCLTDVELEDGLRLVALCQIRAGRSVIFSRVYDRALLETPGGVEYRNVLSEDHDASVRAYGTPTDRLEDITYVMSERNYVRVHMKDGTNARVRGVMDNWELLLSAPAFARVGRSVIVNLTAVQGVQRVARDLSLVSMSGSPRPIRLGRKATAELSQLLNRGASAPELNSPFPRTPATVTGAPSSDGSRDGSPPSSSKSAAR